MVLIVQLKRTSTLKEMEIEWEASRSGSPDMEVEVRESTSMDNRRPDSTQLLVNNTPIYPYGESTEVVVRVEEVVLVALVLLIWVAAIALFINRWGKIRMLEPYQPKFHQQPHRPSCPLAPLSPPLPTSNSTIRAQKLQNPRMSFSKYNVNAMTDPLSALPSPIIRKQRRSSVFVGSSPAAFILNPPPRRTKSAMDIHHLVINERSPTLSLTGSVIPIINKDRRPSISAFDRSPYLSHHRASVSIERPIVALQHYKSRRSSCFIERPVFSHIGGHRSKNFMSFETASHADRKTSINIERPSCSFHHQPIISLDSSKDSSASSTTSSKPLVLIDSPFLPENIPELTLPKLSRSFEQPPKRKPRPERMANSLEISILNFEKKPIQEEERCASPDETPSPERSNSPISIYIDDTKVTAPLLEGLKSSDV
ncbi:uncharacterized protein LOC123679881 isoform X2 [Harmonia axyridis]|uniref:uncharacterized protein LOC123679881 isoform X2 n=1 Tax=Harmonia axyridis TaxID=115357 RepID=UPI001E27888F|nr:uncharacterized protein LOC123679881 isoform X2 [Harmonia axyridis]